MEKQCARLFLDRNSTQNGICFLGRPLNDPEMSDTDQGEGFHYRFKIFRRPNSKGLSPSTTPIRKQKYLD